MVLQERVNNDMVTYIKTLDLYCDDTDKMRIMFAVKFGLNLKIKNVQKIF